MKNIRTIAMLLIAAVLSCSFALADVETTGNVNLRVGPGLDYDVVTSVQEGKTLEFLGETSIDPRGVAWYLVEHKGNQCWISSRYSKLDEGSETTVAYDLSKLESYVEISDIYMMKLGAAAEQLGLENFEEVNSEAPNQYSSDVLVVAGNDEVQYIGLHGGEYTLFGAAIGMDAETAAAEMTAAGLHQNADYTGDTLVFNHVAAEGNFANEEGYDSCINVHIENGVVVEMNWSTYTG